VFVLVYAGMLLGEVPGLALDRTGIALLGAIALVAPSASASTSAWRARVDVPTLALLLGLMVVSAQFRLGGFYTAVTRGWRGRHSPAHLLALLAAAGALSAVLANDIVCLAMAPVLVEICARRRLDPVPFLLALACAANVGSAATLIGNPQNMLIGRRCGCRSPATSSTAACPPVVGLAFVGVVWLALSRPLAAADTPIAGRAGAPLRPLADAKGLPSWRRSWRRSCGPPGRARSWRWPRPACSSCRGSMASREMLGLVDWHLLVLFIGLFVVNDAMARRASDDAVFARCARSGSTLTDPRCCSRDGCCRTSSRTCPR
jgi:Na+/H+ antiporter NhaD/arsenite permease-like protein